MKSLYQKFFKEGNLHNLIKLQEILKLRINKVYNLKNNPYNKNNQFNSNLMNLINCLQICLMVENHSPLSVNNRLLFNKNNKQSFNFNLINWNLKIINNNYNNNQLDQRRLKHHNYNWNRHYNKINKLKISNKINFQKLIPNNQSHNWL